MISRNSTAKLARPWNSEASSEADMVGTRKMDSGSMGSATRRSMSTNTPMQHEPADQEPATVGVQRRAVVTNTN